ncbi:hypothetical protein [Massilia sp. DD77]|uniref:hypothetical protein n=1 Tax=Massilia sp. DD77 TaxID=3109349 RepID=UPI002FFD9EED
MSWLRMPWSIRSVVARDERNWRKANLDRRRLAFSRLERELLFAGEHPFRFVISLLALQFLLLCLAGVLPSDWFTPPWIGWGTEEQLAYFSTLWTVQVTLVALVYPLVIAFVAVFLQRRPAAEVFVHLYMLDSGALAAGLSSVVLVVVMGIQYLMLTTWGLAVLPGWTALDTVWFLLNAALTTFFLYRTVEFLLPKVQARVVQRYMVSVALPRDVTRLNSYQVLAGAQERGWIPIPEYGDESTPNSPTLLIGRFGFRDGNVQGTMSLPGPHRLVDVRLWLVRAVATKWYRRAMRAAQSSPPSTSTSDQRPLLTFPLTPGTVSEGEICLARVAHGPSLGWLQLLLLRWSLVFRPLGTERFGIRVQAILEELAADARQAASSGNNESFERSYNTLVEMHELLLTACLDGDNAEGLNSWAMLPDPETFAGRRLHESWSEVYRGIFEAAIHNVIHDTRPLRRLCHLLQHLESKQLRRSPVQIQEHLLHLPPLMMYLLGNWWSHRVEEQGIMVHDALNAALLRPPFNRVYEEILSSFVSGWENGRPNRGRIRQEDTLSDWDSYSDAARLNARHIDETARMLLAAVYQGDVAAAEWMADVLSKWWDVFDFEHEPHQLYNKTTFITLSHLELNWPAFARKFGIEQDQIYGTEQLTKLLQRSAYLAALRNYWNDIRLLVLELLMNWIQHDPVAQVASSPAAEILVGLLTGRQWRGGGRLSGTLNNFSATAYLTAKARQYAATGEWRTGYVARLDSFVERVKDMRRPNMVSSRVYSFGGADDVESLQNAQLALFAILTNGPWRVPELFYRQIDLWLIDQYRSVEILREQFRSWIERLNTEPPVATETVSSLKNRVRPDLGIADAWDAVRTGLEAVRDAVEVRREDVLAAQPISRERLLEIASFASSTGFTGGSGRFPLQFLTIRTTEEELQPYTLTLREVRRGELTQLEMEPRAVNELDSYAESVARQVGFVVLADILHGCTIRDVSATTAEAYWQTLRAEAARLISRGARPILLLDNATRPDWVWDWQHADYSSDYSRPDDLRIQRLEGNGDDYVCHFNDIAVYAAPLPSGQSILLSRETFESVTFTQYEPGQFVRVQVEELPDRRNLVDLRLTFSRRVAVGDVDAVRLRYVE